MNRMITFGAPVVVALLFGCGGDNNKEPRSPDNNRSQTEVTSSNNPQPSSTYTPPAATMTSGNGETMTPPTQPQGNTGSASTPSTGTSGMGGTTGGNTGGTTNEAPLTDEQIVSVLHIANAGEIEQAKLAQQKGASAKVKQFAAMILRDHTDADNKGKELAQKNKFSMMATTPTGTNLENDAKQFTQSMQSMRGADFDRAYIDAQVKEHQAVIDLIDRKMMPNVQHADLKNLLNTVRPKLEMHLKEAKDIQSNLK
jgi:putative membrane protein